MPIRSFADVRAWLAPWAIAPLVFLMPVFLGPTPPAELWLPIIASTLGAFLFAGAVTGLVWALALAALRLSPVSAISLALAALAGSSTTLVGGLYFGSPAFSVVVFAALAVIAAWRVAPEIPLRHVAPGAARTT